MNSADLSLKLEGTHVLITGASGFIGKATVNAFISAGAKVTAIDIKDTPPWPTTGDPNRPLILQGDITSETALEEAFAEGCKHFGQPVQVCVALASLDLSVLPHHDSLVTMGLEQWRRTFEVNVHGTFLTARQWLRGVKEAMATDRARTWRNVNLIIVGSESGRLGVRGNADYASGKSAVQEGLVQSLVGDAVRIYPTARYVPIDYSMLWIELTLRKGSTLLRQVQWIQSSFAGNAKRTRASYMSMHKPRRSPNLIRR